ncbi:phosphatase ptc7 family protein [Plasmopara halstedii]|uniref:Phosphatase ptc7 family protein n=1 Tax=Plasmopara halstedii TaxID=4781 RepID=A0A0P1AAG0_PLAHL|nr:phosphatase ptc7 family protein [Plasmopara halstedii]CEG37218.1 phosphatase ptc7 family protein [Plasmopara halstedii]|eukprot:XP_024573587.1 phosphatase ptc7 family protein [Plasmopara halstedii]
MARMKLAFIFLTVIASTTSINAINWTFWRDDDDSPASTDTNNENKILSPETLTEMMGSDYMDRVREMIYSGKGSASSFDSDSGSSSSPASNPPISTNFSDDSDDSEDETNKHALLLPSSWDVSMPPMNTIATPSTAVSTARSTFRNWVGPWSQSGDSACYREAHFMNTCPKNYDRNDLTNTCWTECPMEYPVECGMQCIQENNDCVREHGAKVSALAMAILSSASFGVFGELAKISKTLSWAVICADFLLIFVRAVIRFARNQMVNDPQTTTEKLLLLLYQTNYVVADLPATILICSGKTPSKTLQLTRLLLPTVQYILLLVLSYKEDLLVSWDKFKAFMKHVNFTQAADQLTEGEIMSLESGMKQNSTCGDDLKTLTTHRLVMSCVRLSRISPTLCALYPSDNTLTPITNGLRRCMSAKSLPSPSCMQVADLLEVAKQFRSKETNYIHEDQTLDEAVKCLTQNENSATLVVVNKQHQVVGLITNRLALQKVVRMHSNGKRTDWNVKVSEVAIPARKVLYVSPEDSLEDCRAVMALSGVGELPVLRGSKLLGTVSLIDIASLIHRHDAQFNPDPTSAKSDYINLILPRKGLPANTSLDQTVVQHEHVHRNYWTTYLRSFAMSIPHPQKREAGGEDAFFLGVVPHGEDQGTHGPVDVLAMGVADGVGSWFEKGVSARQYAKELMVAAHQAVQVSYAKDHDIEPSEVLHAAWSTVLQREIVGSSTACVLALDPELGELHGINLGDSGFLIIRDKASDRETARLRGTLDGSLMRKINNRDHDLTPAGRRKGAHVLL